jgi:hypothetical protein
MDLTGFGGAVWGTGSGFGVLACARASAARKKLVIGRRK